jgi:hypothetical protein
MGLEAFMVVAGDFLETMFPADASGRARDLKMSGGSDEPESA